MVFGEDKYVDDEVFARAGKPVEVAVESVDRWLKRGGQLVEEQEILSAPPKTEPPVFQTRGPGRPKKSV